jgi:hypothetical protein
VNPRPLPRVVAIVGSRDFKDLGLVRALVRSLPEGACVISGGAWGVDQAAEAEADKRGVTYVSFRPFFSGGNYIITVVEWSAQSGRRDRALPKRYPHFPAAAHARNTMIVRRCVEESGAVVAFHNGSSPGTASVIAKAKAAGVLYDVILEGEELF